MKFKHKDRDQNQNASIVVLLLAFRSLSRTLFFALVPALLVKSCIEKQLFCVLAKFSAERAKKYTDLKITDKCFICQEAL